MWKPACTPRSRPCKQHLQHVGFEHSPALLGTLEYRPHTGPALTLATLIEFVPSDGDSWGSMRNEAARFYEWAAAEHLDGIPSPTPGVVGALPAPGILPEPLVEALDRVELLGRRTADLHRAIASGDDPRFRPDPYSRLYQRSLYQSVRSEGRARCSTNSADEQVSPTTCRRRNLADGERHVLSTFARLTEHLIDCDRIRIHGDLHLAQVLGRGGEVTFIDFEGEPARPIGERSIKRCGLVDIAGMIRWFDYVAHQALIDTAARRGITTSAALQPAADLWSMSTRRSMPPAIWSAVAGSRLVPSDADDVELLLQVFTLHKAMYEVRYELGSRPEWLHVPLRALLRRTEPLPDAAAS